jgi:hypothetical protein
MRSRIALVLVASMLACDPSYSVVVTRPVAMPVDRACAAQALEADSTFAIADSISKPGLGKKDSASIGAFRWRMGTASYSAEPYARFLDERGGVDGTLFHRFGAGTDTVVARTGRLGHPGPIEVQRAEGELTARVNAVVDRCARPIAPARCRYQETGRRSMECGAAR